MARKKAKSVKISKPLPAPKPDQEATAERLAQAGNDNASIEDGQIERAGEKAPRCRRFRDNHIDRLKRAGRLTYAQWYAADWYRSIYEQAGIEQRQTANYQPTVPGGDGLNYGMPTTIAQVTCRKKLRQARAQLAPNMVGLVDAVVLHDRMPAFAGGVQRDRYAARLARALQPLADWLIVPHEA